jgi:Methyltransferase domain
MKPYIFDDAATSEYQRLDLMSKILDPWTRGYLTALRVSQGWQCLELGGGNGSISEWLCATVGSSGSVKAIDINPVLLELIPAQNLTVEQMDVRTGEFRANAYDLVFRRFARVAARLLHNWCALRLLGYHPIDTRNTHVLSTMHKRTVPSLEAGVKAPRQVRLPRCPHGRGRGARRGR